MVVPASGCRAPEPDTTFTLFRRLILRVTSIELLVVVASCAAAAACIQAGPAVRIALVVSVTAGIACGGLWVWGKEPSVSTCVRHSTV